MNGSCSYDGLWMKNIFAILTLYWQINFIKKCQTKIKICHKKIKDDVKIIHHLHHEMGLICERLSFLYKIVNKSWRGEYFQKVVDAFYMINSLDTYTPIQSCKGLHPYPTNEVERIHASNPWLEFMLYWICPKWEWSSLMSCWSASICWGNKAWVCIKVHSWGVWAQCNVAHLNDRPIGQT